MWVKFIWTSDGASHRAGSLMRSKLWDSETWLRDWRWNWGSSLHRLRGHFRSQIRRFLGSSIYIIYIDFVEPKMWQSHIQMNMRKMHRGNGRKLRHVHVLEGRKLKVSVGKSPRLSGKPRKNSVIFWEMEATRLFDQSIYRWWNIMINHGICEGPVFRQNRITTQLQSPWIGSISSLLAGRLSFLST